MTRLQLETDDLKTDYVISTKSKAHEEIMLQKEKRNMTDFSKLDYDFSVCGGHEIKPDTLPLSFYMLKTVEQTEEWYKLNKPELPDYVCESLAKLRFGEAPPPDSSKKDDEPVFSIVEKSVTVNFD